MRRKVSSIQTLVNDNLQALLHADLLRGELSFGTMLENKGFPAVPSSIHLFPEDDEPYFSGGYNTVRHGSVNGGGVDGIQVECNSDIRFDSLVRQDFAISITESIIEFMNTHMLNDPDGNFCSVLIAQRSKSKRN